MHLINSRNSHLLHACSKIFTRLFLRLFLLHLARLPRGVSSGIHLGSNSFWIGRSLQCMRGKCPLLTQIAGINRLHGDLLVRKSSGPFSCLVQQDTRT
ncbi:hypothetical protein SCHPADRAFT_604035 [Schizopora paradoxa]|uniref:Uncharacterized protein n=1 Tax=Schizopora paradoxa TaxID=27342 RepID=A0A0H2R9M1_9AGAM|nr:hypothetical protein SCHPADRAFT_604035 [Schizopora paradoxa]